MIDAQHEEKDPAGDAPGEHMRGGGWATRGQGGICAWGRAEELPGCRRHTSPTLATCAREEARCLCFLSVSGPFVGSVLLIVHAGARNLAGQRIETDVGSQARERESESETVLRESRG